MGRRAQNDSGEWPNRKSGLVAGTVETWGGIDGSLKQGSRGLPGGSSLAKLLAGNRGVRNVRDLPPLTVEQILEWAGAHNTTTGNWPKNNSGPVTDTDETWAGINATLVSASVVFRAAPHLPNCWPNTEASQTGRIFRHWQSSRSWHAADAHKTTSGTWPNRNSGRVAGTQETWAKIDCSLQAGVRGLPGGSSLAKLLAERRCVRNRKDLPDLTVEEILVWADAHHARTGNWPNQKSGQVKGTDETWAGIDTALSRGNRSLCGRLTLAKLLAAHRSVRNVKGLSLLPINQILAWADIHKAATGDWPNQKSGRVEGTDETWSGLDAALQYGRRDLAVGSSLAKLLAEHRGVRNIGDLAPLTIKQILAWADAYKAASGDWPKQDSGQVTGTNKTWGGINSALSRGNRGLPSGSSLAKLLSEHRGVRNPKGLSPLTVEQILIWADLHKEVTGDWPNQYSGQVTGTNEKWHAIQYALGAGTRSLPRGLSLAKLLTARRGVQKSGILRR